jgi:hypothetical protein
MYTMPMLPKLNHLGLHVKKNHSKRQAEFLAVAIMDFAVTVPETSPGV